MTQSKSQFESYFKTEDKDLHVMPDDDKHECSPKCFCEPVIDYVDHITGRIVYLHKGPEELNQ